MSRKRTDADYRERYAAMDFIHDIQRRMDEFENFLIDVADDADQLWGDESPVYISATDYDEMVCHISYPLNNMLDEFRDWQRRFNKAKVKWSR